jgi:hypothetical protein
MFIMTVTLLPSSTDRRVQRRLCLCGAQFEAAVQTLKRPQFVIFSPIAAVLYADARIFTLRPPFSV